MRTSILSAAFAAVTVLSATPAFAVYGVPGAITSFFDPRRGVEHVVALTLSGHALQDLSYDGHWYPTTIQSLPSCTAAACTQVAFGSMLTAYDDGTADYVFFIGTDNHVHEVHTANGTSWDGSDLSQKTGQYPFVSATTYAAAYGAQEAGIIGATLTGFVSSKKHLYFIGTDSWIHELVADAAPDGTSWRGGTLTAPGSLQPLLAVSGYALTATYDAQNSTNRVFYDANGTLRVLRYGPSTAWAWQDFSVYNNIVGVLTSRSGAGNSVVVGGRASTASLPGVIELATDPPPASFFIPPVSYSAAPYISGNSTVLGASGYVWTGDDQNIYEYWTRNSGDTPVIINPSGYPIGVPTNGHVGLQAAPITTFIDPVWDHIFYISTDFHVHELYQAVNSGKPPPNPSNNVTWAHGDLTGQAGGADVFP